jgi:undecaprenyl-diphosphatase
MAEWCCSGEDRVRRIAAAVWSIGGGGVALALAQPINHLVARPRPFVAIPSAEVLVPRAGDYSFPSDHATFAGAVIVGLWLSHDRVFAWIATVLGLLLAFGRIYVGAHYPGDVLGGLALGAAVVAVLWPAASRLLIWIVGMLERTPLRRLLVARSAEPSPA